MKSGICWRNIDPLGEYAFAIAEHFDSFLVMSNMGAEVPIEIHRRWPDKPIIARLYWPAGDLPGEEAFFVWSTYIADTIDHGVTMVQLGNEPDLEISGWSPEEVSLWFIYVKTALQVNFPNLKIGFPMPSVQGQGSWDYALRCGAGIQAADFIAEHCYWNNSQGFDHYLWGGRYVTTHNQWPHKQIHITEYGNSDPAVDAMEKARQYTVFSRELPPYVGSTHCFIMSALGHSEWDAKGFGVTQSMAELMAGGTQTFPEPVDPIPVPPGASGDTHEGVEMAEADRNRLWTDYMAFPAFLRFRADHPELGDALDDRERDYGGYRVKFFAGGIIGCKFGDWANIAIWKSKEDLPDFK